MSTEKTAPQFTDHFIETPYGLRIHYNEWHKYTPQQQPSAAASELTVLCVHGAFQTSHTWDEFAQALLTTTTPLTTAGAVRVVCTDLRGHGDSGWLEPYKISSFSEDLRCVMNQLNLNPSQTILVGMSTGGLTVMHAAAALANDSSKSQQLRGLVVVDITPDLEIDSGTRQIRSFVSGNPQMKFEEFVENAHKFNPNRPIENLRQRLRYSLKPVDRANSENGDWTWKYDPRFRDEFPANCIDQIRALYSSVKSITCPALVVRGSLSTITTPETVKKLAATFPNGTSVEIDNAGHSVMGDNPQQFASEVIDFFSRNCCKDVN